MSGNKSGHTAEPWGWERDDAMGYTVRGAGHNKSAGSGWNVAYCAPLSCAKTESANASRIVAAVNACAGLDLPPGGPVGAVAEAVKALELAMRFAGHECAGNMTPCTAAEMYAKARGVLVKLGVVAK